MYMAWASAAKRVPAAQGALASLSTVMMNVDSEKLERILDSFRRWGYLQANLDPLGHFAPLAHPELDD